METEIFQIMHFFLVLDLSLDFDKNFVPEISPVCIKSEITPIVYHLLETYNSFCVLFSGSSILLSAGLSLLSLRSCV